MLVALVVTGLVVSLAYAASQAGFDTEARLERVRSGVEAEAAGRALVMAALRHALPGIRDGDPVFELAHSASGGSDALRFLTRGVEEPHGASGVWVMSLRATPQGLRIEARPRDVAGAMPFVALLPHVSSIDVRVLGRDPRQGWSEEWVSPVRSPVAVAVFFRDEAGRSSGEPLVARVGLEGNP